MRIEDIPSVGVMILGEPKDGKQKITCSPKQDTSLLERNISSQDANGGEVTIKEEPEDEEPSQKLGDDTVVSIKSEPDESGDDSPFHGFESITPYVCHHCGLEWDKFNDLRRHIKSKHIPKKFKYKCHYCSFRGSLLVDLKRHTSEKHTGAGLLWCPYCYYQTYVPYCLRYHVINKHLKGNSEHTIGAEHLLNLKKGYQNGRNGTCGNGAVNGSSEAPLKSEPLEIESGKFIIHELNIVLLLFEITDEALHSYDKFTKIMKGIS